MLDAVKFIIYWASSNTEAALKALPGGEAAKTRVALRLARRGAAARRSSLLYVLAERAQWLEEMGVDRQTAVEQLVAEYRLRLEERMKKISNAFNTILVSASLVFLTAVVVLILGVLSETAVLMSYVIALMALSLSLTLEGLVPPARRWDYRVAAAAMLPAAAALLWLPAVYLTLPTAAVYGYWYFKLRREAEEEFRMAARGKLQVASTDLAREALDVVKAVRASGAFYIQAAAEYLLRMVEAAYGSLRTDGFLKGMIVLSLVAVATAAISQVYIPLTDLVQKAKEAESLMPLKLHIFDPRPTIAVFGFVAAVIAGRMAESYAMSPIFTPIMMLALLV